MGIQLALIVEDNQDLALLFAMTLETAGFLTEISADGHEAIRRLQAVTPDVVLLDLHLPGLPGEEVLRYIRNEVRLAHTRVIVVTADARAAGLIEGDADLTLIKPVSMEQLRELTVRLSAKPSGP